MQVWVAYEIRKRIILPLHTEVKLEVLLEASNDRLSSLLFLHFFFGFITQFLGELSLSAISRNYAHNTLIKIWIDFSDMWKVL